MNCNDTLLVNWDVGNNLTYFNKKFTKNSAKITNMIVRTKLSDCDLTGYSVRAYFISPNAETETVLATSTVSNNQAEFLLEGNVFKDYGTWNVELVLVGQNGENVGATEKISYKVIETVEGNNSDVELSTGTENSISDLIAALELATLNATTAEASATEINETLGITIVNANAINVELLETITNAVEKNELLVKNIDMVPGEIEKLDNKKIELENATTLADEKKTEVETTITTATVSNTELLETIAESQEKNTTLNETILTGTEKVNEIIATGTIQKNIVETQGDTSVEEVETEGTTQKNIVIEEGTEQKNIVTTEGNTQVQRVIDKNDEYIRGVENDQEDIVNLTQQLMENFATDAQTNRTILNNQTNRSIELLKNMTDEVISTLGKIGG